MSTIYDRAPKELGTFVGRVMKTHHQDLADAKAAPEVRQMMRWQTEYGQLAFFAMPGTEEVQVNGAAEADAPRNDN
jgi:hypothetical protein